MVAIYQERYRHTKKGKLTAKRYNNSLAKSLNNKRWYEKNKYKAKAHYAVTRALRLGILFRQNCEVCGNEKAEAHHNDYTRPLEVRWLCHKCHMYLHMNLLD